MTQLTNSQIDKLGEQLKRSAQQGEGLDLRALDDYRISFESSTRQIEQLLTASHLTKFTQRTKSTPSIIAKLKRRPNMRLRQMQDISGFRFVVASISEQEALVAKLMILFEKHRLSDRRIKPSSGYRAVHLIVQPFDQEIEIQIRSLFQHLWAELSEMIADQGGHDLKYGGGNQRIATYLSDASDRIYIRELSLHSSGFTLSEEQVKKEFEELFTQLNLTSS